ncbi:DNA repair helicase XPB [Evansella tamaricis]|uniref:DNA 3'-5' helicase n=1 Tax=Evansella tamaricis TaxID=2069301 RepID=A0ABS6JC44_9BACI|nr:DNA repair helicase XPB [Evansella tamaricis]MBU9711244.1 DEAD/DEAH box helicase [Evansella tamaricis]
MKAINTKALIIQNNGEIFFRSDHQEAKIIQPFLSQFAQLMKSPSTIHIYQLSPFSVWYALDQGVTIDEIKTFLSSFSEGSLPEKVDELLNSWGKRGNKLEMKVLDDVGPCLLSKEKGLLSVLLKDNKERIIQGAEKEYMKITMEERGTLKQILIKKGYPVSDHLGIEEGDPLYVSLKDGVTLRPYQKEAVESFVDPKGMKEGNGFIILPCGSGKTVVGLGIMQEIQEDTLIIVPNDSSLQQWYRELLEKTELTSNEVGIYTSEMKEVKPVTITTYQILTYHSDEHTFPHYHLFHDRKWGLVIYDEVHLLPAPMFRITSNLQGKRRVGLTATFVREDGKEGDIYSLVGPKRYEVGIKELESNGWIAKPLCIEVKIPLQEKQWEKYLQLSKRDRFRFASENKEKLGVMEELLQKHKGKQILIIGQYLNQLEKIASYFNLPLITGQTKKKDRQLLFDAFRSGKVETLVLSRVANMAIDLPDAEVAIQVSGTYGSRQEEAQRIGRLLRPKGKGNEVIFYTLVTAMTQEEEVSSHRQLFMLEQGYAYEWEEWTPCS